ncbi:unnamed protein product [Angiostrongylus costaricensis]|uniref:Secreted protein n=1 Tax=Angiostrongylus costaricensis TaxID=334426 RepID=A0A0R3PKB1_ANGCS|nr:unnamed protein product [Angiostrongylus costaricensis]
MMLDMRLVLSTLSFVIVTYASPAVLSEERVNAILEKLRRAHAIGELAVNTPTGIYPIKDINKDNFRRIFNFQPLDRKHLNADFTKQREADGEDVGHKTSSGSAELSPKKLHNAEKGQLEKSVKEAEKITTAITDALNAVADINEIGGGAEPHNISIPATESISVSNSSSEDQGEAKENELILSLSVEPNATVIDNQLGEADSNATDELSVTSVQTSDDILLSTETSDKATKQDTENEIEGSAEILEDVKEGSGIVDDSLLLSQEPTTLLTGQENDESKIAASADEPPLSMSKSDANPTQTTLPIPTLPSIELPQFPGVPYIFLPVKSIYGKKLPGLSYLLVPKKYESNLPDLFQPAHKV